MGVSNVVDDADFEDTIIKESGETRICRNIEIFYHQQKEERFLPKTSAGLESLCCLLPLGRTTQRNNISSPLPLKTYRMMIVVQTALEFLNIK